MSASEQLAVLIFVGAVASVLATGAVILALDLVRLLTGRRGPRRRSWVWARRIVLPLAGLVVACMAYGYFIEPYWLEVTEVRIASPGLAAARPIRIVHLSDLHCDPKVRLEEKIPAVVAGLSPDLIVFTGDAVNSIEGLENFRRCMKRLAKVAPCYAVLGNWDVWYHSGTALFAGTGVRVLDAEAVKVEVAGAELWIAGSPADMPGGIDQALADVPAGAFTILLYHYPDEIYHAAGRKVDLYLAGHTHGGQVALPLYGALVTLSRYGKRFERGLHRVGPTQMYVSRGIGMEGGVPRVRFWARPEVTLLELSPGRPPPPAARKEKP